MLLHQFGPQGLIHVGKRHPKYRREHNISADRKNQNPRLIANIPIAITALADVHTRNREKSSPTNFFNF
jgi:hypothetical protein